MVQPGKPADEIWPRSTPFEPVARGATQRLDTRVNRPFASTEEEAVRQSIVRGQPFGSEAWQAKTASRLGLESTFRPRGRPRKNGLADAETPTGKRPASPVKTGKRP